MLTVYTARIGRRVWPDALDVTRKSAPPEGLPFAPSWEILCPALDLRGVADSLRKAAAAARAQGADARVDVGDVAAERIERAMWALYVPAYRLEMRESYRAQRAAWDALLSRESVTLLCYCTDPRRCHRTLLAGMLARLGADVRGEREGG